MDSISTPVNPRPVEHLYRLRDSASTLLYVGITNNWPARMKQHQGDKPWWHEVAAVELVAVIGTRTQLEAIEKAVIQAESPVYNVIHNRQAGKFPFSSINQPRTVETPTPRTVETPTPRTVETPTPKPGQDFKIGDRVCLIGRRDVGGIPGNGVITGTSPGGGCWVVAFESIDESWTLCCSEIELLVSSEDRRWQGSMTPDERQSTIEQHSEYDPEWHFYATRPMQVGWLVEHPELGEGLILDVQPMALDSTVTIKFYDDDAVREMCAEWAPLKVVAK